MIWLIITLLILSILPIAVVIRKLALAGVFLIFLIDYIRKKEE